MNDASQLRRRIRAMVAVTMLGLIVSGATAIPLQSELDFAVQFLGLDAKAPEAMSDLQLWITRVRDAMAGSYNRYPFLAYGTDWLAFGHFVIALVFVGAWRDPVRNEWLFTFGILACIAVVPYALLMGELRQIPLFWRGIDASFGACGLIPLALGRYWTRQLAAHQATARSPHPSSIPQL